MSKNSAVWRLAAIDTETGEMIEHPGDLGLYHRRATTRPEQGYTMIFQGRMRDLVEADEPGERLTGTRARVLLWMLSELEYYSPERNEIGCVVPGRQADIADALGMNSGQVSRAVGWLKEQGVIRDADDWTGQGWEVDLRLAWRGDLGTREGQKKAQQEQRRRRLEVVEGGQQDDQ